MLGTIATYDIIIAAQKRTLQSLTSNAAATDDPFAAKAMRNFYEHQIKSCNRKRAPLVNEVERLNRLVIDPKLPALNFPRYAWHLNEPVIKSELQETGLDSNAQSRAKFKEQVASIHTNRRQSDVAVIASDRMNELLRAKATDPSAPVAVAEDGKPENVKSRWAQQVKLKARSFLHMSMIGKTLMPSTHISPSPSLPPSSAQAEPAAGHRHGRRRHCQAAKVGPLSRTTAIEITSGCCRTPRLNGLYFYP